MYIRTSFKKTSNIRLAKRPKQGDFLSNWCEAVQKPCESTLNNLVANNTSYQTGHSSHRSKLYKAAII